MEIRDLLRVVARRWWLLVAGTVLAVALSYVALRFLAPWPRYQAASTVLIGGNSELDWSALQLGRDRWRLIWPINVLSPARCPASQV